MTSVAPSAKPQHLTLAIDEVLPQTQCTQCGYPACLPYAEAIVAGEAPINRCEPGGTALIEVLARLTDTPVLPPHHPPLTDQVAKIRESDCIGCARCLPACPVDAILGSRKFMHTVLSEDCTGCRLCIDPCPVDCIELVPRPEALSAPTAEENRQRHQFRQARRQSRRQLHQTSLDRATRRAKMVEEAKLKREARLKETR